MKNYPSCKELKCNILCLLTEEERDVFAMDPFGVGMEVSISISETV